jgi:copper(I)-binding protein
VATPAAQPCGSAREKEKLADMECYLMKRIIGAFYSFAFVAVLVAAPARADEIRAGDLVITQAWSRATPGGAKVGGGYLTIENRGGTPDRLIGSSADVAAKVQVHEMTMADGVMKMRPVEGGLTIDPGKTVKLAPSGYHLMIMDLKSPLKQGDKVPITLEFEKAGKVTVTLDVEGIGAQGPGGGDGMKLAPGMKM